MQAVVLQTYDVGEADRFCILLTKERGKLAARARGVRKMKSRMGGSLMQGMLIQAEIHDGKAGALITGVQMAQERTQTIPLQSFVTIQEGVELLMALLHDEEPLPEIYDATTTFITHSYTHPTKSLLPFIIQIASNMGLLPEREHSYFEHLALEQKVYIEHCLAKQGNPTNLADAHQRELGNTIIALLRDHTSRPLKVPQFGGSILTRPAQALVQ